MRSWLFFFYSSFTREKGQKIREKIFKKNHTHFIMKYIGSVDKTMKTSRKHLKS